MHFIVVGLNHKTASVDIRERFHFSDKELPIAYAGLKEEPCIKGSVILSTCNRVEIYASTDNIEKGFNEIIDFISKFHNIPIEDFVPFIYKKNNQFAVSHLFKVAASLDSMVVGEYQIQGQVRDAYFTSMENNSTNGLLNKLFQTAIKIGKKVRNETEIGKGSISVASLSVELIKQIFAHKHHFKVLLIGAGKISTLAACNLKKFTNCKISVANRSKESASHLAASFEGEVADYENRYNAIAENDIVIVSTSSKEYVIQADEITKLNHQSKNKLKLFIDLSIPRNIDPKINQLENCNLYCIDDMNKLIDSNLSKRSLEIDKAEKIIFDVTEEYYKWYSKQFVIPTMHEIKNELAILKQRTIASYKTLYNSLDDEHQKMVSEILDSYSDKLIKVIMKNLKNSTTQEEIISITKTLKNSFTVDINE